MPSKRLLYILAIIAGLALLAAAVIWWFFFRERVLGIPVATPLTSATPAATASTTLTGTPQVSGIEIDPPLAAFVARNLEIPWALDFLPDRSMVFTERPGRVRLVDASGGLVPQPLLVVPDVARIGEGGLLGIAVHPDFNRNQFIYIYYSYPEGNGNSNKVVRYRKAGNSLSGPVTIISGIPGASNHDGGRIKFGPDGYLYIAAGDGSVPALAQDKSSLAGKILRIKGDGSIPPDNPFTGSPIYSYGHRNPQGLAWDDQGRLWATEHGSSATDELNLVQSGKNYGWPVIRGEQSASGMESPVLQSGTDTWAPSGTAFRNGSIFFGALRGQSLFQVQINNQPPSLQRHLNRSFGRIRDVVVGPDGLLYITTSNRDGRGVPSPNDDQIIRINPSKL
ncbi:MAG: PQQ-dependent sugar dehydrogenase [Chloroflexi bacterium]|nr:PQQ-dependent sugar dehydrogenase [Chloroflexota bacterium]